MDLTFLEVSGSQTQASELAGSDDLAKPAYDLRLGRGCSRGLPERDLAGASIGEINGHQPVRSLPYTNSEER
jgi:hypothetical protein